MSADSDDAFYQGAITMALYTDYESTVGEPPRGFSYEILHVAEYDSQITLVTFRGICRLNMGGGIIAMDWPGVAYFEDENIVSITQYLDGGPYVYNV